VPGESSNPKQATHVPPAAFHPAVGGKPPGLYDEGGSLVPYILAKVGNGYWPIETFTTVGTSLDCVDQLLLVKRDPLGVVEATEFAQQPWSAIQHPILTDIEGTIS